MILLTDSRFILSQNFADIIYKLVMPGKLLNKGLTDITHIWTVYLNNKVLTAHLSLSLSNLANLIHIKRYLD